MKSWTFSRTWVFNVIPVVVSIALPVSSLAQKDEPVNCALFKPVPVNVDGQKVLRFNVTKSEQLRCLPPQPASVWNVTKGSWSQQNELDWQNFIRSIGQAVASGKCSTVDTCLVSSANPYRNQMDMKATHFADCADFPMYLRAYFSYKNNLPFTFGIGIRANAPNETQIKEAQEAVDKAQARLDQAIMQGVAGNELLKIEDALKVVQEKQQEIFNPKDLRYTRNGNYFSNRINVPSAAGAARSFFQVAKDIQNQYSTASYRMLLTPVGQTQADFYSPAINSQSIRIGTVAYKPTGHAAIVYDITPNGEIKLMDAHPDNSVTTLTYSSEYVRSLPTHAGGFKNWRPFRLLEPQYDGTGRGVIKAAKLQMSTNEEIPDFSLEQYFGNIDMNNTTGANAKWVVNGRVFNWFDYVKMKVSDGRHRLYPLQQFKSDMDSLCTDLKGRANSVETALQVAFHRKAHPENLPRNIYGAEGDWEAYSTPGRDLRIRKRVIDIIQSAKTYVSKVQSRDPLISYDGNNLKRDLLKIYNQVSASCVISYRNSSQQTVQLGLGVALKRLTSMSFDPYFCPERRWGAVSRAELKTCADDAEKAEWYQFQQFLRNATERDPNEVMGWSLSDLKSLDRRGAVDNTNKSDSFDIFKKLNEL